MRTFTRASDGLCFARKTFTVDWALTIEQTHKHTTTMVTTNKNKQSDRILTGTFPSVTLRILELILELSGSLPDSPVYSQLSACLFACLVKRV